MLVVEVADSTAAAVVAGAAAAVPARTRHHPLQMVAKQRASNLFHGFAAGAPLPRGPAAPPTWPSSEAWWSTDRQSRFLI